MAEGKTTDELTIGLGEDLHVAIWPGGAHNT
jgi:hypothetical protein